MTASLHITMLLEHLRAFGASVASAPWCLGDGCTVVSDVPAGHWATCDKYLRRLGRTALGPWTRWVATCDGCAAYDQPEKDDRFSDAEAHFLATRGPE